MKIFILGSFSFNFSSFSVFVPVAKTFPSKATNFSTNAPPIPPVAPVISIFLFFMIISSANLIFTQFFSEPFHREEFFRESVPFLNNVTSTFFLLFRIPNELTWTLFKHLPYAIFLIPLIFLSFFSKNEVVYKFLIFIFCTHLILTFLYTFSMFGWLKALPKTSLHT